MDWAGSAAGALETWRSDDGFRVAVVRGVPGAVGVGVGDAEGAGGAGLGLLKVEVDAVAWCVGWRYGERDWPAGGCKDGRGSSLVETLLIVSSSSLEPGTLVCFRSHTRLAIARG
jgi:hypothetical protein